MKRMFPKLTVLLLLFTFHLTFAQDVTKYEQHGLFQHFIEFKAEDAPSFTTVESFMHRHFKASAPYGIIVVDVEKDELGVTHYRLQQTLNNIPIANSMLLLHVKDDKVLKANGEWYKDLPSLKKEPALSKSAALNRALNKVNARIYIWETKEAEMVKSGRLANERNIDYNKPEGELVYVTENYELDASKLTLAYRFNVFAVEPYTQENVYVDATSGEVIFKESLIHEALTNGTANTGYYGAKSITVDQSGGRYYARQTGARNFELYNGSYTHSSTSSTFSGTGNAKYYIDVYWGAEVTWDFYKEKFSRNGYDNAGSKIRFVVNDPQVNNNAYWQNGTASFGNSNSGTPFTSLDVVAHEVTHGVTGTSARLVYRGESGALNEAFSDIFGSYAEHYANVGDKWTIGEYISFQRSMSNPNRHRQPDTYQGTYWASTTGGDNGGVHTNSGVLNYWFYLTAQGGSGTNDRGSSFSVTGIGIEKAAQIAYRALTRYLTSSSGYSAARTAVINAARDLYGAGSCEEAAATEAMYAVGMGTRFSGNCNGGGGTCNAVTGLGASQVGTTSATVSWNAVSGVSSYTLEYKPSSSSSYTVVNVSTNSRSLSGLTASTTYNVRVKYTCSNGTEAAYATASFTTSSGNQTCSAVSNLKATNITNTSAQISWDAVPGVSRYTFEYKTSLATSYTAATVTSNSEPFTGLTAGTTYNIRISYICSNGQRSPYSSVTFTAEPGDTGGSCAGVSPYASGKIYMKGDRVVYLGTLYEASIDYVYWVPTYGWWYNLGPCSGATAFATEASFGEGLALHPNPASGFVNITLINHNKGRKTSLRIYNSLGAVVYEEAIQLSEGANKLRVTTEKLQPGVYLLSLDRETKRLIIE